MNRISNWRFNTRRTRATLIIGALSVVTLTSFQNCGSGFTAAGTNTAASQASTGNGGGGTTSGSGGGGSTVKQQCESSSYRAPTWGSTPTTYSYTVNLPPDTTMAKFDPTLVYNQGTFSVTGAMVMNKSDNNLRITPTSDNKGFAVSPNNNVECVGGKFTFNLQLQDQCAGITGFTYPSTASKSFTVNYTNTCPNETEMTPPTTILDQQNVDFANPLIGTNVASDGNVVVMTAPGYDNGGVNSGAAFVFSYPGMTLLGSPLSPSSQQQQISSVDIKNGIIVLGTSPLPTAPNGGAVFIYKGSGSSWSLVEKIPQPNPSGQSDPLDFGAAVKILSNGDIAVGAPGQDVNGNSQVGAVYIYSNNGSAYSQSAMLTPPNSPALGEFGSSLATSGNYLVVGAPFSSFAEKGGLSNVGTVYVYNGLGSTPMALTISKSSASAVYQFGQSVATDGQYVAVGAPLASISGVSNAGGGVYLFNISTGKLLTNQFTTGQGNGGMTASGDNFGSSVAISNGTLWVGAPDNSTSTGAIFKFAAATSASNSKAVSPTYTLVARSAFRHNNSQFGASFALVGSNIVVGSPGYTIRTSSTSYTNSGFGFVIQQP